MQHRPPTARAQHHLRNTPHEVHPATPLGAEPRCPRPVVLGAAAAVPHAAASECGCQTMQERPPPSRPLRHWRDTPHDVRLALLAAAAAAPHQLAACRCATLPRRDRHRHHRHLRAARRLLCLRALSGSDNATPRRPSVGTASHAPHGERPATGRRERAGKAAAATAPQCCAICRRGTRHRHPIRAASVALAAATAPSPPRRTLPPHVGRRNRMPARRPSSRCSPDDTRLQPPHRRKRRGCRKSHQVATSCTTNRPRARPPPSSVATGGHNRRPAGSTAHRPPLVPAAWGSSTGPRCGLRARPPTTNAPRGTSRQRSTRAGSSYSCRSTSAAAEPDG